MKKLFIGALLSLASVSAFAVDAQDSSTAVLDNYMEAKAAVSSSGWDYLGCANSKADCQERAIARGYTEIRTYPMCGPRNQYPTTCFAK